MTHPSDDFERRLADVLLAEAEAVVPAPHGLDRIRRRIERRRARLRWLRPTLAVLGTAAVGTAAVAVFGLAHGAGKALNQQPNRPPAVGATERPAPLPTALGVSVAPRFPLWPFNTAEQVSAWRSAGGPSRQPELLDPAATALGFARYLGVDGLQVLDQRAEGIGRAVTLGRTFPDGKVRGVTVVHLARLSAEAGQPYLVRYAGAYHLQVADLPFAARMRSPATVSAVVDAGQHTVQFALWTAERSTPLAGPVAATGAPEAPPNATLSFTATNGTAMLVATEYAAGGPAELTAVPVLLPRAPAQDYPPTFVGVTPGHRVAIFSAADGSLIRYLSTPPGGSVDAGPVPVGAMVYFVRRAGECAGALWRVPLAGGPAERVFAAAGAPSGLSASRDNRLLAWVQGNCAGGGDLRTLDLRTGRQAVIPMDAPPVVAGRPAFGPDDRWLAFRYAGSMGQQYPVAVLDLRTARTTHDAVPRPGACGCNEGLPAYLPDGSLLVVVDRGAGAAVEQYAADGRRLRMLFTLPGTVPPTAGGPGGDRVVALSVAPDGVAVLAQVTRRDGSSQIYRWNGRALGTIGGTATDPAW